MGKCKKCQNYRFLDIFVDILHKLKGNLGQEHVKRAKLEQFFSATPGKMTAFQFFPYFSTHPSLKSGFLTWTKIIFLKKAIIGLFSRKVV